MIASDGLDAASSFSPVSFSTAGSSFSVPGEDWLEIEVVAV